MKKMKDELNQALTDVRLSSGQKNAILHAAQEMETLPRKPKRKRYLMAAAVLAVVCLMGTAAATSLHWFDAFRECMGSFETAYQPQEGAAVQDGIEVCLAGVLNDSTQLEILFTARDLKSDRIGPETKFKADISPSFGNYMATATVYPELLKFDENTKTGLFRMRYVLGAPYTAEKPVFTIQNFYHWAETDTLKISTKEPPNGIEIPNSGGLRVQSLSFEADGLHIRYELPEGKTSKQYRIDAAIPGQKASPSHSKSSPETMAEQSFEVIYEDFSLESQEALDTLSIGGKYMDIFLSGNWELPLDIEPLAQKEIHPESTPIDGNAIGKVLISPVGVRIESEREDIIGDSPFVNDVITVHLKDGTAIQSDNATASGASDGTQNRQWDVHIWTFDRLLEPNEVVAVTLRGVDIPVTDE